MAVKSYGFKRIAKEPLKPAEPEKRETLGGVPLPTRAELEKMTASEAYQKGQEIAELLKLAKAIPGVVPASVFGDALKDAAEIAGRAAKLHALANLKNVAVSNVTPVAAPMPPTGALTLLFKKSATGIGFKQWSIWQEPDYVIVEWGHCDKQKQQKRYSFLGRERAANEYVQDCIMKKMKEGYKRTK